MGDNLWCGYLLIPLLWISADFHSEWWRGRTRRGKAYIYVVDDKQYWVRLHQVKEKGFVVERLFWGVTGTILSPPESRWDGISSVQVNLQNKMTEKNCAFRAGNYKLIAGHTRDPHWWDENKLLHWLLIIDNIEIIGALIIDNNDW